MTKESLRKLYLDKRLALSEADYVNLSNSLCENFFSFVDLSAVKVLHTFLPIEKTKEPNTWLIIERIKKEYPDIKIAVPKINTQTSNLDHFYFEGKDQLTKNTWGIPEPVQGIPVPLEKIDAVLVPLLVFDQEGHRVGYGRGFYDKFLNQCPENLQKIGLSLFPPVELITDVNPNDHKLTVAVTPQKAITFR
jgi:5-formyltetrahydrofolate cyclo-ligase